MGQSKYLTTVIASAYLLGGSAQAVAETTDDISPETILQQAIEAQQKAHQALEEANRALAAAQELLEAHQSQERAEMAHRGQQDTEQNDPGQAGEEAPKPPPIAIASQYPGKEKACDIGPQTAGVIAFDPRSWARDCLGQDNQKEIYDLWRLNLELLGSASSGQVSILPSYTWRSRAEQLAPYRTRYLRIQGGARIPLDPGQSTAVFADLTTPEVESGVQGVLGFEWGGTFDSKADVGERVTSPIQTALQKAREDCFTAKAAKRAFNSSLDAADTRDLVADACTGSELAAWMGETTANRLTYLESVVQPAWHISKGRQFYLGAIGTYARPNFDFFPLTESAMTGEFPILTQLPDEFPKGTETVSPVEYSIKTYFGVLNNSRDEGGFSTGLIPTYNLGLSLSYRRDFEFAAGTKGQTVCRDPADGSIIRCFDVNIAEPFELDGFVLGGLASGTLDFSDRFPKVGIEIRTSYAFDIDRAGILSSLYFSTDNEGTQKGGIKIGCATSGETRFGLRLDSNCEVSFFFGTAFTLDGRP
ncbi:MAG: hypothetical protein AAF697_00685 [Pseudomonadota bacterium]